MKLVVFGPPVHSAEPDLLAALDFDLRRSNIIFCHLRSSSTFTTRAGFSGSPGSLPEKGCSFVSSRERTDGCHRKAIAKSDV